MRNIRSVTVWITMMVWTGIASGETTETYRLPHSIQPAFQAVELRIDPAQPDYSGTTTIDLSVAEATDRIGIYQLGLSLDKISLSSDAGTRTLTAESAGYEINWLADGDEIPAGDYDLTIDFSGKFSTDALGMHRVDFEDNAYVFTQFEAMFGRRAFPLFDEPEFKIPYQLTIAAPDGLAVVANTPVDDIEKGDGWQIVRFMKTKPLPSYLIAYAVGPLDRAPITGLSVPGYIYTPKGHADEVEFVVRETPNILAALENYFDLDYPYRKLDFLAVPDFAFGAMENPGLITYRTDLLQFENEVRGSTAETVLNVVAHEVAHIWYGDLVTMKWWDDLWLNEAFATWMAQTILRTEYPQYENTLKLPQSSAFAADQRTTSKAIRRTVRNTPEIMDGMGLNYTKGHSILNMLEEYVGAEMLQESIRRYIRKYSWSNATERDLWNVISETSGLDVASVASDYLNQPGFAKIGIDRDGNVEQQRYVSYGRTAPDLSWQVPLNVKYKKDQKILETTYLLKDQAGVIDVPKDTDWIFPDAGGNGYYRWVTDSTQFYNLIDDADKLTDRERIALLSNSKALLDAGDLTLADYLFALDKLLKDKHPLVFLPALEALKDIGDSFTDSDSAPLFAHFVDESLTSRFLEVGTETDDQDSEAIIKMRPRLMRVLGEYGNDPTVREAAARLARQYLDSPTSVSADLGREALRVAALSNDGGLYEQYQQAYLKSSSADFKSNILASIYFDNEEIIREHLDFSMSSAVTAGDALTGLTLFAATIEDHTPLYNWLNDNMDTLLGKIPEFRHAFLPQFMAPTCNQANLDMLKNFFEPLGDAYSASLVKAVETSENCIARKEREREALVQFLQKYSDKKASL